MRKLLAPAAAITLFLATASIALAWQQPTLTANCAPDENSFAWTINLQGDEANFLVDLSWDNFATAPFDTIDFGAAGDHDFTTPRGGSILYVRWASDPKAGTSVSGNADLCVSPEQTVEAGTGTPAGSVPNTSLDGTGPNPLPTILFSLVLLASLGTLAYTNVKVVTGRNR